MSTREQWFNLCKFTRRDQIGIDPITRTPMFAEIVVLDNEPCDLFNKEERIAQQTNAGTVYTTVARPILKIYPDDYNDVPDYNDMITVDGTRYNITTRRDYWDAGSGEYRGSRFDLQRTNVDQ